MVRNHINRLISEIELAVQFELSFHIKAKKEQVCTQSSHPKPMFFVLTLCREVFELNFLRWCKQFEEEEEGNIH